MYTQKYTITGKNISVASTVTVGVNQTTGGVKNGAIPLGGDCDAIAVQVSPVGSALDAFVLQGRVLDTDAFVTMASSVWGTATAAMPVTTGDVAATADGATHLFIYDVRGLDAVRFQASAALNPITTLTIDVRARYAI